MALYYAIRRGKVTGIVKSWEECKDRVTGVSGAEFKGFNSIEEAEAYMSGTSSSEACSEDVSEILQPLDENSVNVFIRGSYNRERADVGIVLEGKDKGYKFYGELFCPEYAQLNGFAGELLASMISAQLCAQLDYKNLNMLYTYDGVQKWCDGRWLSRNPLPIKYNSIMRSLQIQHGLKYNFIKRRKGVSSSGLSAAEGMLARAKATGEYIDIDLVRSGRLTMNDVPLYTIT